MNKTIFYVCMSYKQLLCYTVLFRACYIKQCTNFFNDLISLISVGMLFYTTGLLYSNICWVVFSVQN